MTDVAQAYATAQEAALRGSAALATAMGLATPRIYEIRPTNAPFPYVVIGQTQVIDDSDDCQDGSEIVATVHVWSKPNPPSGVEARAMTSAIRSVLNADLNLNGHSTVVHEFLDAFPVIDPEGATHVVIEFRYLTIPTTAP